MYIRTTQRDRVEIYTNTITKTLSKSVLKVPNDHLTHEIQECLFLYSVYWCMAFTIMVHPSHCFGGLARPLRCWARPWIYHKQGI